MKKCLDGVASWSKLLSSAFEDCEILLHLKISSRKFKVSVKSFSKPFAILVTNINDNV